MTDKTLRADLEARLDDIFNDRKQDAPKKIGLVVPEPLSSAELEEKYATWRHDGIEILWPTMFEDQYGHISELTPHDLLALKHLGITVEEFYLVELERCAR